MAIGYSYVATYRDIAIDIDIASYTVFYRIFYLMTRDR